jgi:hypothetical protein
MEFTHPILRIFNEIIDTIKVGVSYNKYNNNPIFKNYLNIFNSLKDSEKKFIVRKIFYSRARIIRYGIEHEHDVHLEGLGTFKFREDSKQYLTALRKELQSKGYERVKDAPTAVKYEALAKIDRSMDKIRLDRYFGRLTTNKAKKFKPQPISIKLNKAK